MAISRYYCSKKGSFLIIDGLSNFGLELIDLLVVRGARNIIIASNSKNSRKFCNYRMNFWRKYGVTILLRDNLDFSKKEQAAIILNEASKLGQIEGIFDLQRMNLTQRNVNEKDLFTKSIDEELKKYYCDGQKFVICSTVSEFKESCNELIERECEIKKICEKPTKPPRILILWGPIEGIVQSKVTNANKVSLLTIPRAMEQFDRILESNASVVGVSYKAVINEGKQVFTIILIIS